MPDTSLVRLGVAAVLMVLTGDLVVAWALDALAEPLGASLSFSFGPRKEKALMLNTLLPRQADNAYRGQKAALWVFALVVLLNLVIGFNSSINTHEVATVADGIPLDTFPPAAAQTIVALFALLGLSRLTAAALYVVVLVRYRALVPLVFVIMLVTHLAGRLMVFLRPIVRVGSPPATIVNFVLLALLIVGLALSLWRRGGEA